MGGGRRERAGRRGKERYAWVTGKGTVGVLVGRRSTGKGEVEMAVGCIWFECFSDVTLACVAYGSVPHFSAWRTNP